MENILIKDGHAVIADFGFASKDEVKWTSGTPALYLLWNRSWFIVLLQKWLKMV